MRQGGKRGSSKEIDTSLPRKRVEMKETQNGKRGGFRCAHSSQEQPRGEVGRAAGV